MKKIFLFLSIVISVISCRKKEGLFTGLAMHFSQESRKFIPDSGAEIYIVSEEDFDTLKVVELIAYPSAKVSRNGILKAEKDSSSHSLQLKAIYDFLKNAEITTEGARKYTELIRQLRDSLRYDSIYSNSGRRDLNDKGMQSMEEFDKWEQEANEILKGFVNYPKCKKLVSDVNGIYLTTLPVGKYCCAIISKNETGHSDLLITRMTEFSITEVKREAVSPSQ